MALEKLSRGRALESFTADLVPLKEQMEVARAKKVYLAGMMLEKQSLLSQKSCKSSQAGSNS